MTIQNPELLLKNLNSALRDLRGAWSVANVDGAEEVNHQLLTVMRRLLLAEVLGSSWLIAVGGSQGAGKTTLMSSLYDCDTWLQGNEGRGEKLPVLIMEQAGLVSPQGFVRRLIKIENENNKLNSRFELTDIPVDPTKFQQAICDPNIEDLLPILHVPAQYFRRDNQAWLLLPGYEKADYKNEDWQLLMRQALIAAGGCLIVTDETRMANQQQLEIVQDMLKNELRECKPYIVITKTEEFKNDQNKLNQLKTSAQETFQVHAENVETHIILTGQDSDGYTEIWRPQIEAAVYDLSFSGNSNRISQINQLSALLGDDLKKVLRKIRSKTRNYFATKELSEEADIINIIEETYQEAVEELEIKHSNIVKQLISSIYGKAKRNLDDKLAKNHEGFINFFQRAFDTHSQTKSRMEAIVLDSWRDASDSLTADYAEKLTELTLKSLGDSRQSQNTLELPTKCLDNRKMLGYVDKDNHPIQFSELSKDAIQDIRLLLGSNDNSAPVLSDKTSKKLEKHVKLVPTIALEYSRIVHRLSDQLVVPETTTQDTDTAKFDLSAGMDEFKKSADLGRTAIKSVATLLAVDVVSDGDSDILGALFGKTQLPASTTPDNLSSGDATEPASETGTTIPAPVALHPAAIAVTAAVAVTYLSVRAISGLRSIERKASDQAHSMLLAVQDAHIDHLQQQFNQIMKVTEKRIRHTLRANLHLDEELMFKTRLAHALADADHLAKHLQTELASSAADINPLLAAVTK